MGGEDWGTGIGPKAENIQNVIERCRVIPRIRWVNVSALFFYGCTGKYPTSPFFVFRNWKYPTSPREFSMPVSPTELESP